MSDMEHVPAVKIDKCTILHISDLHIPYQAQEVVDYVIDKHADSENTLLVIGGDLLDSAHLSSFPHTANHTPIDEVLQANQLVEELSTKFKHIFIMDGNHERRLNRKVGRNMRDLAFMFPDTLNYYVARKLRVGRNGLLETGEPIKNVTYVPDRFFLIDNILFSHPAEYSSNPGATVKKVINSAISNHIEFDIAVIGHTHQVQKINYMGKIGIEAGCLSQYRDYITKNGRMDKGFQLGYALLEVNNSVCYNYVPVDLSYMARMVARGAEVV